MQQQSAFLSTVLLMGRKSHNLVIKNYFCLNCRQEQEQLQARACSWELIINLCARRQKIPKKATKYLRYKMLDG